jgi:hypothetical protein
MLYEQKFLLSLFLTLVAEVPVLFLFVKYIYKYTNIKTPIILFVGVLASALTLPYLWFILPAFVFDRTLYILLGETIVILVETFIYFKLLKLNLRNAFICSLIANLVSIILGYSVQILLT